MIEASTHKDLLLHIYIALVSIYFALTSLLQPWGITAGTRCPCKPKGHACDPKAVPDAMLKLGCASPAGAQAREEHSRVFLTGDHVPLTWHPVPIFLFHVLLSSHKAWQMVVVDVPVLAAEVIIQSLTAQ